MAKFFPGFINHQHHDRKLGALGGIYVQTKWQMQTGRNKIPAWSYINKYLTVKPYEYFLAYLTSDRRYCQRNQACLAWRDYFEFSDIRTHGLYGSASKRIEANRLLWRAHEASLSSALSENPNLFLLMKTPSPEKNYLEGWIRFVHVLASSHMPTSEFVIGLFARPSSPHCSPLGAPHCEVKHLRPSSKIFVKNLIKIGESDGSLK
jgi:hypothetical protein